MLKTYWNEYKTWLKAQWKEAWLILRDALIIFVNAIYTWLYSIIATIFVGLYKIVIKPIIELINKKFMEWVDRI